MPRSPDDKIDKIKSLNMCKYSISLPDNLLFYWPTSYLGNKLVFLSPSNKVSRKKNHFPSQANVCLCITRLSRLAAEFHSRKPSPWWQAEAIHMSNDAIPPSGCNKIQDN